MRIAATLSLVALLITLTANFAHAGKDKGDKEPPGDVELTGTVQSETVTKTCKDGNEYTKTIYTLKTDDGAVYLPQAPLKKKDGSSTGAADLSTFVDKEVNVSAKGWIKKGKNGKEQTILHSIVSVALRTDT